MQSKKPQKIQKNVELVSAMASQIEEMKEGERMRVTPFAKSIILSNNSHPHVETVKGKLMEALLWKEITPNIKFFKKRDQITEIEKIKENNPDDFIIRKEIRNDLTILKNRMDKLDVSFKNLEKSIKKSLR